MGATTLTKQSGHYVITGTSGTGKTALINTLARRGFSTTEEAARRLLMDQLEADGPALPAKSPQRFLDELARMCLRTINASQALPAPVFHDRGYPDVLAYAVRFQQDQQRYRDRHPEGAYAANVFLLAPWKEIFVNDEVRTKPFQDYLVFHEQIVEAYRSLGFTLIEVPKDSPEARADFVVNFVESLGTDG